jgi:hypothetical protein
MLIARSTCSKSRALGSNPLSRSRDKQRIEPQRKRIRFSLVTTKLLMTSPLDWVKSEISPEATSVCRVGMGRGAWKQRDPKEMPRNLGDPKGQVKSRVLDRMHKVENASLEVGGVHSSVEAGTDRGAKGLPHESATYESRRTA